MRLVLDAAHERPTNDVQQPAFSVGIIIQYMKHNRATAAIPCSSLDTADGEWPADQAVTGARMVLASKHAHQAQ